MEIAQLLMQVKDIRLTCQLFLGRGAPGGGFKLQLLPIRKFALKAVFGNIFKYEGTLWVPPDRQKMAQVLLRC